LSFMKGFDALPASSPAATRRAAKMVIPNNDYPDIVDFIDCSERGSRRGRSRPDTMASPDSEAIAHLLPNANNLRAEGRFRTP
jgi:hypothetical protein